MKLYSQLIVCQQILQHHIKSKMGLKPQNNLTLKFLNVINFRVNKKKILEFLINKTIRCYFSALNLVVLTWSINWSHSLLINAVQSMKVVENRINLRFDCLLYIDFIQKSETVKMPQTGKTCKIQLQLQVSCRDLNKLFFKEGIKSFLIVKAQRDEQHYSTIFKGNPVQDDYNPNYMTKIVISHDFLQNQRYIFQIHQLGSNQLIGKFKTTVRELLTAPKHILQGSLRSFSKKGGKIIICSTITNKSNNIAVLKMRGQNLKNNSWLPWKWSDCLFFRITDVSREEKQVIYQSEVYQSNTNFFNWKQFQILNKYSEENSNEKQCLKIDVLNHKNEQLIGSSIFTLRNIDLIKTLELFDTKDNKCGQIVIQKCQTKQQYPFYEYVEAGLQLNLIIGIDFSASNGVAKHASSLHFKGQGKNHYLQAIQGITDFILDYSQQKHLPIFALGTKVKHPQIYTGPTVQQCFPLTCDLLEPIIDDHTKSGELYHKILEYLQFSGPTKICELLAKSIQYCKYWKTIRQEFTVVTILTDGKIGDKQQAKQLLQKCALLPIYIIFIGVGKGPFNDIQQLANIKCQVMTVDDIICQREGMIKAVTMMDHNNSIKRMVQSGVSGIPSVVARFMELKKASPSTIRKLNAKMMKTRKNNPQC